MQMTQNHSENVLSEPFLKKKRLHFFQSDPLKITLLPASQSTSPKKFKLFIIFEGNIFLDLN